MSRKNNCTVSNLIQNIGKCRDILATKDFKEILTYISLFERTQIDARRRVNKYTYDKVDDPDFLPDDLGDLAEDIRNYLDNDFPIVFSYSSFLNLLDKFYENQIDDTVFRKYSSQLCDYMYVDTKLRETMKILSYCAVLFKLWQISYKNKNNENDVMFQITDAIKNLLKE